METSNILATTNVVGVSSCLHKPEPSIIYTALYEYVPWINRHLTNLGKTEAFQLSFPLSGGVENDTSAFWMLYNCRGVGGGAGGESYVQLDNVSYNTSYKHTWNMYRIQNTSWEVHNLDVQLLAMFDFKWLTITKHQVKWRTHRCAVLWDALPKVYSVCTLLNNNNNEIFIKCQPLMYTRARCTVQKHNKTAFRLGQYK